jgi:hypothetical protein
VGRPLDPYGQLPLPINLTPAKIPVSMYVDFPSFGVVAQLTAFSEPQHSRPRPCGYYHLLVFGICKHNKRNCEPYQYLDHPHPDQAHRGCRKHAIQPYLPEPNRGTGYRVIYLLLLLLKFFYYSLETGSSNQYHFHTFH